MKVAIFGASGFIGRALVKGFLTKGIQVVAVDIVALDNSDVNFKFISASVFDLDDFPMDELIGVDVVIYLISTTTPFSSNLNISKDIETNLIGFVNLLHKVVEFKIPKVIYASSGGAIYSNDASAPYNEESKVCPLSSYGIHKIACEMYLSLFYSRYDLQYLSLRISNPYGEGQELKEGFGVVPTFVRQVLSSKEVLLYGEGKVERDFVYIGDLVEFFHKAVISDKTGIYNVGSGVPTSILDLLSRIEISIGKNSLKSFLPLRPSDIPSVYLNVEKAERDFAWKASTSLDDGIYRYINWYESDRINVK